MCPALPHREAQEGQRALLDLGPEGVSQLKEGRSRRGNSTSKGPRTECLGVHMGGLGLVEATWLFDTAQYLQS